ncbi:MAG: hypothetical protein V7607_5499 [Solirubrobacteraceae bacterium]
MSPALTGEQRRGEHGDRHLDDEDQRRDLGRGAALQRGHLAEQREARAQSGGERPRRDGQPLVRVAGIGDELRRQAAGRERGAGRQGGDHAVDAPPTHGVGSEGNGGERGEPSCERPAANVVRGGVRRGGGQPGHPRDDRPDGERVASSHGLVERAGAEREQQHEAEGQGRLHDGQRREQQRGGLQRPAEQPQGGAGEPARPARQPRDEREAKAAILGHDARLDRLQRDPEAVHRGRRTGSDRAEHDGGHERAPR